MTSGNSTLSLVPFVHREDMKKTIFLVPEEETCMTSTNRLCTLSVLNMGFMVCPTFSSFDIILGRSRTPILLVN